MDSNEETVQKHVVVNSPERHSEVLTERTVTARPESGVSTGTIVIIAILALTAIGAIFYIVSNRNANEAANRNANQDVAAQVAPVQQPAPQQQPLIIQNPAQQPPVIIQQPAATLPSQPENTSANNDAGMQDIATKSLAEDPSLSGVVMTVNDARAVLTGTVNSAANKAKAEQLVKAVRGMKAVDNRLVVSSSSN